ncbi:protein-glutamate O-methyltransferase CheR [Sphingomonas sp. SUN019]|uniref:CheR family methyltransferase n=1 Tax=Sphingomonas sp. SUN019 TaxID=2937788 RepID=UPI002164A667|nr:protein-glutamate O-methyltransferase CheR [Sphingomonas sp. SUN019]UVO52216.1 protein-glutamate O-methyltransferase CheR [Sphingomonas sp. SUN019]
MTGLPPATTGAVNVLAALLEARTGQQIAANRSWRIDTSLKPLLVERGLDTIEQLVGQLLDGRDTAVGDRIVDAMLNQESSFFRDAGVIESTAAAVREIATGVPRIWSAGCAAGQEPLSLAMAFAEGDGARPEIIASDVSAATIARARAGRFNQFEIQRGLPIRRMMQWFEPDGADWVAAPDLLKMVSFRRHNLVADRPPPGPFDAIFCRNVLFYLTPALRTQVLDRIATAMRPGGLLVLGAGETVIGQTERFVPSRRFRGFYEAVTPPAEPRAVYNAS